jgi:creatinine amidohydrolase
MNEARLMSWPAVRALAQQGAVALLPVGATEAHGPHLPLAVDVIIAEEVCRRLSLRLGTPTIVFPSVTYSLTEFAAPFSGTVSLPSDTARASLIGVISGIALSGFRTIGVINHHLEPAHFRLVHEAAGLVQKSTGATVVVPDHRRAPTGPLLGDEDMHGGSHAGHYETSLMLAAAPHLVDDVARRALPALEVNLAQKIKSGAKDFLDCGGPDAYFGAPASASAAEGQRLFDILVASALARVEGALESKSER